VIYYNNLEAINQCSRTLTAEMELCLPVAPASMGMQSLQRFFSSKRKITSDGQQVFHSCGFARVYVVSIRWTLCEG
ncbi:hypothetical protein OIO03_25330, partial [Acinetobacter baumannii]|nr:hypothetical protein [Acinetobacter baumannii]MCW1766920.1 hypothetical protein [Acinetobacter baumannii]